MASGIYRRDGATAAASRDQRARYEATDGRSRGSQAAIRPDRHGARAKLLRSGPRGILVASMAGGPGRGQSRGRRGEH